MRIPARQIGFMCRCGVRLIEPGEIFRRSACGESFSMQEGKFKALLPACAKLPRVDCLHSSGCHQLCSDAGATIRLSGKRDSSVESSFRIGWQNSWKSHGLSDRFKPAGQGFDGQTPGLGRSVSAGYSRPSGLERPPMVHTQAGFAGSDSLSMGLASRLRGRSLLPKGIASTVQNPTSPDSGSGSDNGARLSRALSLSAIG